MINEQVVFSVTALSQALREAVEGSFSDIQVKGEVSMVKQAASGHIYFSIKDSESVLNAICWRGHSPETRAALVEGMDVICRGHLSTYPSRSNYQMIVSSAEPAGIGALLKQLEVLKKKLAAEGLFDEARKKPIPYLPQTIGVISSPTGAVIRDIMHRIAERFGRTVYLYPVLVQGQGAAQQVVTAVQAFNALPKKGGVIPRPDVLIVARGGGSLEDLWCFNDERVARAVAASDIPVISAIGHETDTTLIDFVADKRAPTPTAAAEMAVPVRSELLGAVSEYQGRLGSGLLRTVEIKGEKVAGLARGLPDLSQMTNQYMQRLDDKSERFLAAFSAVYVRLSDRLAMAGRLLEASSYQHVLDKGFAFVTDQAQAPVTSAATAGKQASLDIHFKDGVVPVQTSFKQGSLF